MGRLRRGTLWVAAAGWEAASLPWHSGQTSALYTGGTFTAPGASQPTTSPTGMAPRGPPLSNGVRDSVSRSLAIGPDGSLYAGGYKLTISRWDGTTWHPLGSGSAK